MPRAPQVLAGGDAGGLPGAPRMSPEGFANLSTLGIRTGAKELGQAAQSYESAYKTLRAEDEKLDAERGLGEAQRQFADAEIALKSDPTIDPEQYPQAVERSLRTIQDGVGKTLRYPGSRLLFERGMLHFGNTKAVEAKYEGLKMMHAQVKAGTTMLLRQDENQAVFGATPELQEEGLRRGLARIQTLGRQRILTGDEMNSETTKFMSNVERGKITADARNRALRPVLIQRLINGEYSTLDAPTQLGLAKTLQDQADHEAKAEQEAMDKWFKERQKEKVSDLFARAGQGQLTPAELERERKNWRLGREDYHAIQTEMGKPAEEAASDPSTLNHLDVAVHSATPTVSEGDLNAFRARGLLNRKDFLAYKDKLVARNEANRKEANSENMQRHNQAEQAGRAAFEIPALYDKLDGNKGKIWAGFLRELTARSNAFKGQEDALAVAREIIPRYKQQLGEDATLEADKIRGLLLYQTVPELKAARAAGTITEGQFIAQEQLFMDLNQVLLIEEKNQEAGRAKAEAERRKKEQAAASSWYRSLLPTFGKPPANAPAPKPAVPPAAAAPTGPPPKITLPKTTE